MSRPSRRSASGYVHKHSTQSGTFVKHAATALAGVVISVSAVMRTVSSPSSPRLATSKSVVHIRSAGPRRISFEIQQQSLHLLDETHPELARRNRLSGRSRCRLRWCVHRQRLSAQQLGALNCRAPNRHRARSSACPKRGGISRVPGVGTVLVQLLAADELGVPCLGLYDAAHSNDRRDRCGCIGARTIEPERSE